MSRIDVFYGREDRRLQLVSVIRIQIQHGITESAVDDLLDVFIDHEPVVFQSLISGELHRFDPIGHRTPGQFIHQQFSSVIFRNPPADAQDVIDSRARNIRCEGHTIGQMESISQPPGEGIAVSGHDWP
jgi:hypothetical protein